MKKLGELVVGDRLYEGAGKYLSRAGRLVAVMEHPCKRGILFLLAIQRDNQLTLYQGPASGPYLNLARSIPANVFCEFCGVVNAGISIHDDGEEEPKPAGEALPPPLPTVDRTTIRQEAAQPLCLVDFP